MFHDWTNIDLIHRNCVGTILPLKIHEDRQLPFRVDGVGRKMVFQGVVFDGKSFKTTEVSEDDLSISQIRLGYTYNGRYLARKPMRDWRQGIRPKNISVIVDGRRRAAEYSIEDLLTMLYYPMSGDYPKFEEALGRMMRQGAPSVAFSRNFCVDSYKNIYHKGQTVGNYSTVGSGPDEQFVVSLYQKFHYLKNAVSKHIENLKDVVVMDDGGYKVTDSDLAEMLAELREPDVDAAIDDEVMDDEVEDFDAEE